ncbi:hypothetical protein OS176_12220 [Xanthomonadaceae bacterium XH05]|nr:hypothetical protein [Xanthomonadaceae bacterium XH05]
MAWVWLAMVLLVAGHHWRFWQDARIDTDVLALLPRAADDVLIADATARIAESNAKRIVILLGAADAESVVDARSAFRQALSSNDAGLVEIDVASDWFDAARAFYAPHRDRLLTEAQRVRLAQAQIPELVEQALSGLYGSMGARLTTWLEDPLGLWPSWWQERAASTGVQLGDDGIIRAQGLHWAPLQFDVSGSAFRLDGEAHLSEALNAAVDAARTQTRSVRVLRAGVPLHAEAAAFRAHHEINTIGWGSLAAVLLLAFLAFGSLRPIALVAGSLVIGCAVGLSVTVWVFGQVHLLTLVFGASLVGVAEDYGIHWFATRQGHPGTERWRTLRHLLPGLWLALATSAAAYLALGIAPFPGLRQMAIFSVAGLTGAFLTSILWFPWLDTNAPKQSRFSRALGASLKRWPRARWNAAWGGAALILGAFILIGVSRLEVQDDLRTLQSSPPDLIAEQVEAGQVLGLPSPAQFFLVRGTTEQQLLEREEALVTRLFALRDGEQIGGWRALSDWIPSDRRQRSDAEQLAYVESAVLEQVSLLTDEVLKRPSFDPLPLDLGAWLQSTASLPARMLWIGELGGGVASVVMIDDPARSGSLAPLHAVADAVEGVRFVDRASDYSALLGHYRLLMSWLLVLGTVVVFGLLLWRFRSHAWRAMLPTLLAALMAMAVLGWIGSSLQLFNVLALILLLGMGIDYGIFLLEHPSDESAWLAVCVGAASTWLSFGLLSLSATPALHAFGITLLLGIGLVWTISPLFRSDVASRDDAFTPNDQTQDLPETS